MTAGLDNGNDDSNMSDAAALSISASNVALGSPVVEKRVLAGDRTDEHRGGESPAEGAGEGELELMYDPVLNCYYDQSTGKYYELR